MWASGQDFLWNSANIQSENAGSVRTHCYVHPSELKFCPPLRVGVLWQMTGWVRWDAGAADACVCWFSWYQDRHCKGACHVQHAWMLDVLHGEGIIIPVTPRNQNLDQPGSNRQRQEALQTQRNQTKCKHYKPTSKTCQSYTELDPEPHQGSQHTCHACMHGCARMHPIIRRQATQYMHPQTVTTRRGRGCNVTHEAPCDLSAHRIIGITSESSGLQSL